MNRFYSHGKLLLTGEYVVLDGAIALAIPTTYGQSLEVNPNNSDVLYWESYDEKANMWFSNTFTFRNGMLGSIRSDDISDRLLQLLNHAKTLNPSFLEKEKGHKIKTRQDFNRFWGLGTSSTLVNNIATWAEIDAYALLEATFGGSGYDIACAQHDTAITYQLVKNSNDVSRRIVPLDFDPPFKDHLYFVYMNKKQNSRDGIASYRQHAMHLAYAISELNEITTSIIQSNSVTEFSALIDAHETMISKLIKQPTVKETYFSDFDNSIKSLGAWGGDFILVISRNDPRPYFSSKGLNTVIDYRDMVLNHKIA